MSVSALRYAQRNHVCDSSVVAGGLEDAAEAVLRVNGGKLERIRNLDAYLFRAFARKIKRHVARESKLVHRPDSSLQNRRCGQMPYLPVGRAILPAAGFQPAFSVVHTNKSRLKRRLQPRLAAPRFVRHSIRNYLDDVLAMQLS
jgi:hypothetical protein